MAHNSKNDDDYQFARPRSTWKPNFAQIGWFLYFGGHFGFKMAAIANQNGRRMVQHVLLPVNIHFHWNLFIFEFSTIYFDFILAAILKWRPFWNLKKKRAQLWVMIYFCVKFQKDPLYGVNLTFFAPWLPWQRPPFWICSTRQKLPHTTVEIPTKFHEVWW
jgi:hypothetical protein